MSAGSVLYFHGFASSPAGAKVESFRTILRGSDLQLVAPDLNVPSFRYLDFDEMVRLGRTLADEHQPRVIVGSSLGALVALGASSGRAGLSVVLIAPAIGDHSGWVDDLPDGDPVMVPHHAFDESLPVHRAFFEKMALVELDREPPAGPVTVFMGTKDDVLPFERIREAWDNWELSGRLDASSRFVAIEGGDHRLIEQVPAMAEEIVARATVVRQ